jgi:ketosteroid isomerase-like protein
MRSKLLLLTLLFTFGQPTAASEIGARVQESDKAEFGAVRRTAEDFLDAFRNLEWERFQSFFAEDATAFFPPSAREPKLAEGKPEIETVFKRVFAAAQERSKQPPYLAIEPKSVKIQMLGNVAIVTFHLEDPDLFGRRTVVFQKREHRWLIVHLHASGTPYPQTKKEQRP